MNTNQIVRSLCLSAFVVAASIATAAESPPPNEPTSVQWDAGSGRLTLEYRGGAILQATVTAKDADGQAVSVTLDKRDETQDDKVGQVLALSPAEPKEGVTLTLTGKVDASGEAFPAETQSAAQNRFEYVRNSVGLSHNLRNNAIYDRRWDWALAGPGDGATRIVPKTDS